MRVVVCALLLSGTIAVADPAQEPHWSGGEHLTGEWGGARAGLADDGVTIDAIYATEWFAATSSARAETGARWLGHADLALTVDTGKAFARWPGGKLYVLGQNNHGTGINDVVPSATQISNLENTPNAYTQLTEAFLEQSVADDRIVVRLGKQDANRDFGTPRYGGNFLNNNFGMFPTAPLPSYPTTGLGAALIVTPVAWLATKLAIYEGNPKVGSYGFDTAFAHGATATVIGGLAATRHYGAADRDEGTTSVGVWHQTGTFATVDPRDDPARTYRGDTGFFVQHDEHLYLHPEAKDDPRGLNVIARFGWAQAERTAIARFLDVSIAWHGIGGRHDDTVGIGAGSFTVAVGDEVFGEVFYKLRFTSFISVQLDVEAYRHPGGAGPDALLAGGRLKLKL